MKDADIARSLQVGRATVERTPPLCGGGFGTGFGAKEQLNRRRKRLDGQGEAHLIALATAQGAGQLDAAIAGQWTWKGR